MRNGCRVALVVPLVVAVSAVPALAYADDTGTTSPPTMTSAPGPKPGTEPEEAPVREIDAAVREVDAGVADIVMSSTDLEGKARIEERPDEIKVTLDTTLLFEKDSAKLRSKSDGRLNEVAERLAEAGPGSLSIVGYTDDLGSAQHGLVLSRRRAAAVAEVLKPHLDEEDVAIDVVGKGEADPAVPNDSEAHRRLNRRVELTFKSD